MKDVLTEAMDIEGLKAVLSGMADGRIRCIAVDTPVPSQFSHEILNANPYAYLDDAPLEERRARAVQMRRMLPESVLEEVGGLDPAAIAQVREEAWPDVRDADELHDVLHTLVALPEDRLSTDEWSFYFERLFAEGRAASLIAEGKTLRHIRQNPSATFRARVDFTGWRPSGRGLFRCCFRRRDSSRSWPMWN